MAWDKFRNLGFILADKFQKLEIQEDVLESCVFPVLGPIYTASIHPRRRERRCSRPTLVSGRWNAEYCKLCGATA